MCWISPAAMALRTWGLLECGPSLRFMVAWFLGPLVLLELVATKLVHYWMPSYPAGVLLVVGWLVAESVQPRRLALRWRAVLVAGGLAIATQMSAPWINPRSVNPVAMSAVATRPATQSTSKNQNPHGVSV